MKGKRNNLILISICTSQQGVIKFLIQTKNMQFPKFVFNYFINNYCSYADYLLNGFLKIVDTIIKRRINFHNLEETKILSQ